MNNIDRVITSWQAEPTIGENIAYLRIVPARKADYAPLPRDLHPLLVRGLHRQGIASLYSHQAQAWDLAQERNLVIVTGTASGKSLCYNLPVLNRLLNDPFARALYLFPTKALSQDQLANLKDLLFGQEEIDDDYAIFKLDMATYDGDTPTRDRAGIRKRARLVISNPDMLHSAVLPHHTAWAELFQNLRYIVIDEMHIYRGVFGSHVANVLRRLKRIASYYGAHPQFILTSATIANPLELAESLIEEQVHLINDDGSAQGLMNFVIYNPPIVKRELGLRRSALHESVRLAETLIAGQIQTLIFGRSRRTVELILAYLRDSWNLIKPNHSTNLSSRMDLNESIRGYRSGYLSKQRRQIERGLRQGNVRAVVATNALELGINIGGMGSVLMVGYPGSIASTWQQAGRAGRGDAPSLVVLIATADPLDQYLAHHPNYLFDNPVEQALIDANNMLILLEHIRCAAFELPFRIGESFGRVEPEWADEYLKVLTDESVLHYSGDRYYWMADDYPSSRVSLRAIMGENILLQVRGGEKPRIIGMIDHSSATWMVHTGAIYLHEGQTYLVDELNLDEKVAHLSQIESDYYTTPQSDNEVKLIKTKQSMSVPGGMKTYGEIVVKSQLTGYKRLRWFTNENLGYYPLTMPPSELQTKGYWITLSADSVEILRGSGLWQNDPNRYGPNWDHQRDLARARDNYLCRLCGISEQGRKHDVHHIIPFRTFDDELGNPAFIQANRLENLMTLCPNCHRKAELSVRVRSGLAGLAYVFGNLSPLFLMCDSRDLGIHSDPQSPLGFNQPTIVLYEQIPAGIGFSQKLFELHDELISKAYELVKACQCTDGCPSCVGPGGENGAGGKQEAIAILQILLQISPSQRQLS